MIKHHIAEFLFGFFLIAMGILFGVAIYFADKEIDRQNAETAAEIKACADKGWRMSGWSGLCNPPEQTIIIVRAE